MDERTQLIASTFDEFLRLFPEAYRGTAEIIRASHPLDVGGIIRIAFEESVGNLIDRLSSYPR